MHSPDSTETALPDDLPFVNFGGEDLKISELQDSPATCRSSFTSTGCSTRSMTFHDDDDSESNEEDDEDVELFISMIQLSEANNQKAFADMSEKPLGDGFDDTPCPPARPRRYSSYSAEGLSGSHRSSQRMSRAQLASMYEPSSAAILAVRENRSRSLYSSRRKSTQPTKKPFFETISDFLAPALGGASLSKSKDASARRGAKKSDPFAAQSCEF